MDDKSLLDRIHELVAEEKNLRASGHSVTAEDRARLKSLELQLDQCWDLLRQRRAKAEFGDDPDTAHARPVNEVEGYLS
jgi:hypothetical protein